MLSRVTVHPEAAEELLRLPPGEALAIQHAIDKLEAIGDLLRFPHQSKVQGADLRELRPRGGRSPWRAFYRRVGAVLVVAAIAPEARVDPQGFQRAIRAAERRLAGAEA
jgi:phage-related protein